MVNRFRPHLPTLIAAVVASLLTAGGPALAGAVYDAVNADKVDGRHAVGAGAKPSDRAGKLVATDGQGMLPNAIIARAPDAARFNGFAHAQTRDVAVAIPMEGAEGFFFEGDETKALRTSFVVPRDYTPGAPIRLDLVYRAFNACDAYFTVYGYVYDPATGEWNHPIESIEGEHLSGDPVWVAPEGTARRASTLFSVTTPPEGDAHLLTLTLDAPAPPGAAVTLNLQRLVNEPQDTCEGAFTISAAKVRY